MRVRGLALWSDPIRHRWDSAAVAPVRGYPPSVCADADQTCFQFGGRNRPSRAVGQLLAGLEAGLQLLEPMDSGRRNEALEFVEPVLV